MKNKTKTIVSGIYAIKNRSNNKMYIGSACDIYKRWSEHKSWLESGLHNKKLQKAWNDYGSNNFIFIILEVISDSDMLLESEQSYINNFNTYENGYNANKKAIRTNKIGKPVYQYDSFGNFIKEYKSASEASRIVGVKTSGIVQSCNKNKLSAASYIWRYKEDILNKNNLSDEELIDSHWTPILQYDIHGNFIKEWRSIIQAAKETNSNHDSITGACVGRNKTAGGFVWKYKNNNLYFDKISPEFDSRKRPVIQFDLDGNFIKEWDSATSAAKDLNINRKYIFLICNGQNKRKTKKFIWKWKVIN